MVLLWARIPRQMKNNQPGHWTHWAVSIPVFLPSPPSLHQQHPEVKVLTGSFLSAWMYQPVSIPLSPGLVPQEKLPSTQTKAVIPPSLLDL